MLFNGRFGCPSPSFLDNFNRPEKKGHRTHSALGIHPTTKCSDAGRTAKTRSFFCIHVGLMKHCGNTLEILFLWLGIGYFFGCLFQSLNCLWSIACCIGSFTSRHQSKRGTPECCHLGNEISSSKSQEKPRSLEN